MAGVKVDTTLMQSTALQGGTIAENMLTQARTLVAGLEFVRANWRGAAGDAFRLASVGQEEALNRLVTRLETVVEQVRTGGVGFEAQEATAQQNVTNNAQGFLSGAPLNTSTAGRTV